MRYGIVGSRARLDIDAVHAFIDSLRQDDVVISGGCQGVDIWAVSRAKARGLQVVEHLPVLPNSGSPRHLFTMAYYARNKLIARDCDILVAFVAPARKGGTENTIRHAKRLGKEVMIL